MKYIEGTFCTKTPETVARPKCHVARRPIPTLATNGTAFSVVSWWRANERCCPARDMRSPTTSGRQVVKDGEGDRWGL